MSDLPTGVLTYDYHPVIGGGGKHVHEVVRRLPGREVLVWSGRVNQLEGHRAILPRLGHGFVKQFLVALWVNLRLDSLVRRHGLKRLNLHTGPGGLFLLGRPRVPLAVTAHHTYRQQVRNIPSQGWKRIFIPLERRTLRLADRVICVSEDTRREVVEGYGVGAKRTLVIPNGIDPETFKPLPEVEREPASLLYLSRLEKRKGVDFLLRAFALVLKRMPEARLYVGGKGSLLPELETFVADQGMADRITFLGFVPDADLNRWYNRVSGFVMPSMFEGFGIPVIEAQAAGTPVVATDVEGLRELIEHDKTGLLAPYGDEPALAAALLQVLRREFTAPEELSGRIRREYDWDRVAKQYAQVLNELAG